MMLTVIDVMKSMKIEITPELSWAVGATIREMWRESHDGELPEKELRAKTAGIGSHCFAVYPPEWEAKIREVVGMFVVEKQRQGDLFL